MTTAMWVCLALVVLSALCDLAVGRIPNVFTFTGLIVGVVIHAVIGAVDGGALGMARGIGMALLGCVACAAVPFIAWRRGQLGGGDVKLLAAVGALLGVAQGFDVEARAFAISLLVLFPYRLIKTGQLGLKLRNAGRGIANMFRSAEAKLEYETPHKKFASVIFGPTVAAAAIGTFIINGALR